MADLAQFTRDELINTLQSLLDKEKAAEQQARQAYALQLDRMRAVQRELDESRNHYLHQLESLDGAVLEIADELASVSRANLPRLLQIIVGQARLLADAEFAAFGVMGEPRPSFSAWVFSGMSEVDAQALAHPPRPVGLLGAIVTEGKTLRLKDLREHPKFVGFPAQHPMMTSFLGVPVRYGERVVGNIYLTNKRGGSEFTEEDAHFIEMLARRAGAAIEIARLNELEARERAGLFLLTETTRALDGSLSVEAIFEAAERIAMLSIPAFADYCVLYFTDGEHIQRSASAHRDPTGQELLARLRVDVRPGSDDPTDVLTHAFRTRTPVLLTDLIHEPPPPPLQAPFPEITTASFMAIPLVARDRAIGIIAFGYSDSERRYEARDVLLAEAVSMRLALAVDNARLYETAQAAIRSRDSILAIVSHDLRTPLASIGMAASLLLQAALEDAQEPARRRLEIIQRSAALMSHLIEDLLTVTTIEAGSFSLDQRPVEVGALVGELVETLTPLAAARSLALEQSVAPALPMVLCDRERVLQVLSNLVGNSLKFTPPAGRIHIAAALREGEVCFTVQDTGRGIPEAELPHLFDRYWKSEAGGGGVGLGLAIVKGIVAAHRGKLWVQSTQGQGSTFSFTLPTVG